MASEMSIEEYEQVRRLIRPAIQRYVKRFRAQRREDLSDLLTSETLLYFWRRYQASTEDQSFVVWSQANIRLVWLFIRNEGSRATSGDTLHGYRVVKSPARDTAEREYVAAKPATYALDTRYELTELLERLSPDDRRVAEYIINNETVRGLGRTVDLAGAFARIAEVLK